MSRLNSFIPNEYYHLYNRGANKMAIFLDNSDHERFQKLLYIANSRETGKLSDLIKSPHPVWEIERGETLVDIGAYCLMPNHFHIIIKAKNKEDVALFLQRIQMSYSKYFNIKNDRSGLLFQGKSKATSITNENQFRYLFSYIHLNPIKLIQKDWKEVGIKNEKEALAFLFKYKYSSYLDFLSEERPESKIINIEAFPNYFPTPELFEKEITEWLNYEKDTKNK